MRAHRHPGDDPVAGAGLLHPEIHHEHLGAGEVGLLGVVDPHLGVENLAQHEHFAGPLNEPAQGDVAGGEGDRIGLDGGDAQDRYENPLRVSNSTTRPSTRGCWRTMLMLITTSRTRPRDSPSGPSTTIPASRAAYTLFTDAMTTKGRVCGWRTPIDPLSAAQNVLIGSRQ